MADIEKLFKPHFQGNLTATYEFIRRQRWNPPHWWAVNYDCSGLILFAFDDASEDGQGPYYVKLFSDWYAAQEFRILLAEVFGAEWIDEWSHVFDRGDALEYLQRHMDLELEDLDFDTV